MGMAKLIAMLMGPAVSHDSMSSAMSHGELGPAVSHGGLEWAHP